MRHTTLTLRAMVCLVAVLCLSACNKEDDASSSQPYPSIIYELADVKTDQNGTMISMATDSGHTYEIENKQPGYVPKALYRLACGYVPTSAQRAHLYQLDPVQLLRDSTDVAQTDPTNVVSAWKGAGYINMQLAPLTQGGRQYWGFIIEQQSNHHAYVTLHHKQNGDPESYTETVYASLPTDSLKDIDPGDDITLSIHTPQGIKIWQFKK